VLAKGQPGYVKEYSTPQTSHLIILKGIVVINGGMVAKGVKLKVLEFKNN
jgi:hypothetical protein